MSVVEKYVGNDCYEYDAQVDEKTWANQEQGCEILRRAGFMEVNAISVPLSGFFPDSTAALDCAFAWPLIRLKLEGLDQASYAALHTEALAEIGQTDDLTWEYVVNYFKAT